MKVSVKFSFKPKEMNLETQNATLGALLAELSNNYKLREVEFYDSDRKEVCFDCDVLLNGQSYQVLSSGLDTRLKNGDKVEILKFVVLQGG